MQKVRMHSVDRVHRNGTRAKHTEAVPLNARPLIRRYIEKRTAQPWTPPEEAPNRKLSNSAWRAAVRRA